MTARYGGHVDLDGDHDLLAIHDRVNSRVAQRWAASSAERPRRSSPHISPRLGHSDSRTPAHEYCIGRYTMQCPSHPTYETAVRASARTQSSSFEQSVEQSLKRGLDKTSNKVSNRPSNKASYEANKVSNKSCEQGPSNKVRTKSRTRSRASQSNKGISSTVTTGSCSLRFSVTPESITAN
jgi:hypothetical protein